MADPRLALEERTVLVIDEGLGAAPAWLTQLRHLFTIVTTASLAGASVALGSQEIVAVVLVLGPTSAERARALVTALRRHRSCERVGIFVIGANVQQLNAELAGLQGVEVLDPAHAEYDLSLQIGAAASRMSSRPAPRRLSSMPQMNEYRSLLAPPDPARRMLARFAEDCGERGARGLSLCERISARETTMPERQRAAEDLRSQLHLLRGDAAILQLDEISSLLGLAEQVVGRLNTAKGQVVVPRGVVGLLSAVADLRSGPDQLATFDTELHRARLQSALDRS